MDKIEFEIGFGEVQWVIKSTARKVPTMKDANNWKYITSLELINRMWIEILIFLIL